MLMKDFIKQVRASLENQTINDDSGLEAHEFLEAQSHLDYLRQLLNQYADSDIIITKENVAECTQPFLSFLAQRWLRIANSGASYQKAPNAKANKYCKILAEQLLMLDQKFEYKNRDLNRYLMPPVKISMAGFLDYALNDLNTFLRDDAGKVDLYVYLESVYALNRLKAVLQAMTKTDELVTPESLEPIFQLMRERYDLIQDTKADYPNNPQSDVNNIYTHLAKLMQLTLELNGYKNNRINANRFLMHNVRIEGKQTSLQTRLLAILADKSPQNVVRDELFNALRAQQTTPGVFAERVKTVLAKLEKDDANEMPLLAYLESRRAIRNLKAILSEHAHVDQPLTKNQLEVYINFLSNRWNEIDGTLVSYTAEPQIYTRAYNLCQMLVNHIILAAYELDHLNRDSQYLLMRTPHTVQPEIAANHLRLTVTSQYNDLNEMLDEMLQLPHTKWCEFIGLFETEKLINLLSNGKSVLDEALKTDLKFDQNESRSRAVLVSLFLTYAKTRQQVQSDRMAIGSSIVSLFKDIPTLKQKTTAVDAVCEQLLSGAPIVDIARGLNDTQSPLFPHRAALQDKRLKGCWDQLELAARQLPQPVAAPSLRAQN